MKTGGGSRRRKKVSPIFEQAKVRMTVVKDESTRARSIDKFLPYSRLGAEEDNKRKMNAASSMSNSVAQPMQAKGPRHPPCVALVTTRTFLSYS